MSEPLVRQAPPAAAPQRDAVTAPTRTDDGNQRIAASGQADGGNRSVAGTADRGRDSASEARPTPAPATADTTQPTRTATAERRLATAAKVVPQPRATAAAPSDATPSAAPDHVARASDDARFAAQLRELQAESAQLKRWWPPRATRVASAAAAVMSADLDQRLRLIDTALIDGALPANLARGAVARTGRLARAGRRRAPSAGSPRAAASATTAHWCAWTEGRMPMHEPALPHCATPACEPPSAFAPPNRNARRTPSTPTRPEAAMSFHFLLPAALAAAVAGSLAAPAWPRRRPPPRRAPLPIVMSIVTAATARRRCWRNWRRNRAARAYRAARCRSRRRSARC
ncbi:hypothetical protein FE772_05905 [Lysobacter enzymogenes]|nr:hypothetical protein [Lysobacter enzymogenes]QCW25262.1 hypothetical protein FE772_05905 [Lysobacter enzymogenes]